MKKQVFKEPKGRKPYRLKGYTYVGSHIDYPVHYYLKRIDEIGNFNYVELKTEKFGFRTVLGAGTTIKVLDAFMYNYLKYRDDLKKDKSLDKLLNTTLSRVNVEPRLIKYYSTKLPKELKNDKDVKNLIDEGFKVLYVMNNEDGKRKFAKVQMVLVKEEIQKIQDFDLSYIRFKYFEFMVRPSYVKKESKEKYIQTNCTDVNIPVSILN